MELRTAIETRVVEELRKLLVVPEFTLTIYGYERGGERKIDLAPCPKLKVQ